LKKLKLFLLRVYHNSILFFLGMRRELILIKRYFRTHHVIRMNRTRKAQLFEGDPFGRIMKDNIKTDVSQDIFDKLKIFKNL